MTQANSSYARRKRELKIAERAIRNLEHALEQARIQPPVVTFPPGTVFLQGAITTEGNVILKGADSLGRS